MAGMDRRRVRGLLLAVLIAALVPSASPARELSREQLGMPSVEAMEQRWGPIARLATYKDPVIDGVDQAMSAEWIDNAEDKAALLWIEGKWGVQRYRIVRAADGKIVMTYAYGIGADTEMWRPGEISTSPTSFTLVAGRERLRCAKNEKRYTFSLNCDVDLHRPDGSWSFYKRYAFLGQDGVTGGFSARERIRERYRSGAIYPIRAEASEQETLNAFVFPGSAAPFYHFGDSGALFAFPQAKPASGRFQIARLGYDLGQSQVLAFRTKSGRLTAEGNVGRTEKSERGPVATLDVGRGGHLILTDRYGKASLFALSADGKRFLLNAITPDPQAGYRSPGSGVDYGQTEPEGIIVIDGAPSTWGPIRDLRGGFWKTPYGYEKAFAYGGKLELLRFGVPGQVSGSICAISGVVKPGKLTPACSEGTLALASGDTKSFVREGVRYTATVENGRRVYIGMPGNLRIEPGDPFVAAAEVEKKDEAERIAYLVEKREKKEAIRLAQIKALKDQQDAINRENRRLQAEYDRLHPQPAWQPPALAYQPPTPQAWNSITPWASNPYLQPGGPNADCEPNPIDPPYMMCGEQRQRIREAMARGAAIGKQKADEMFVRAEIELDNRRAAERRASYYYDRNLPDPLVVQPELTGTDPKKLKTFYFYCHASRTRDRITSYFYSRVYSITGDFIYYAIHDAEVRNAFGRELTRAGLDLIADCQGPSDSYSQAADKRADDMRNVRSKDFIAHALFN